MMEEKNVTSFEEELVVKKWKIKIKLDLLKIKVSEYPDDERLGAVIPKNRVYDYIQELQNEL